LEPDEWPYDYEEWNQAELIEDWDEIDDVDDYRYIDEERDDF
jgi:hypothetical protein